MDAGWVIIFVSLALALLGGVAAISLGDPPYLLLMALPALGLALVLFGFTSQVISLLKRLPRSAQPVSVKGDQ